jgi:N-acyl-D-amino-acid deacylase
MPRLFIAVLCCSAICAATIARSAPGPESGSWDLVVRNGRVLDGSGNPWRLADLAVANGRIVAMGRFAEAEAPSARVIDARGLIVAPGFVDVHSHALGGLTGRLRHAGPLLAQGITTVLLNPDGDGPVNLRAQQAMFEPQGAGVNIGLFVPHGAIRREIVGMADRDPTSVELTRMRSLVRDGMAAGAVGLSTGLYYAPGSYASTEEVIALARIAAESGGVYASHVRDEADYSIGVVAAVDEVIRIGEEARIPAVVSHMKALGPRSWGLAPDLTLRIEQARARGVQVYADQYAYDASGTSLVAALVPRWAEAGGRDAMLARLRGGDRRRLLAEISGNLERRGGPARLAIADFPSDRSLEGRTLEDIAGTTRRPVLDVIVELVERGDPGLVSFNMSDADIAHIMRQPWTMTCTDGELTEPGAGKPHPRGYGGFARKLAVYARDRGVIGLEHAVRSMTSLPATVFGLRNRGTIQPGAWADLVIFDPPRLRDAATYAEPQQIAEGMRWVLVNGQVVIAEGAPTGALAGRVLRPER